MKKLSIDLGPATTTLERRPRFEPDTGFRRELRRRVGAHFAERGISDRGRLDLWVKTAVILAGLGTSWALLVFWAASWATALPLAVAVALGICGTGFSIMHDGGHGAYSNRRGVNRLMAYALDLTGGSSYFWAWKHNRFHHTYTNIEGLDDDLDGGGLSRMAPFQRRRAIHRLQFIYAWVLYGVMAMKWQLYDDLRALVRGRTGKHPIPRPRGWELVAMLGGKAFALSWLLVIPLAVRPEPAWVVLAVYAFTLAVTGLTLSVVFQLAHVVGDASFSARSDGPGRSWAEHQVATTCDFGRDARLLSWFVGGLNFQVEHHLFPRVSHVHYRDLSRIVEEVAREHGVPYTAHRSAFGALRAHVAWLYKMGRPEPAAAPRAPTETAVAPVADVVAAVA